jgi:NTE family protein
VAKAVAASSAVPLIFLPVVLKNYSSCHVAEPEWLQAARIKAETEQNLLLSEAVRGVESLLRKDQRNYIHRVDGGITDNLGLHALHDFVNLSGGTKETLRKFNKKPPSTFIVISVNSSTDPQLFMDLSNKQPSVGKTINAMSNVQLHRHNTSTLELIKYSIKDWAEDLSTPEHQVKPYFIRVGLHDIKESDQRLFLNQIPTSFSLNKDTVDRLVKSGIELLYNNPEYLQLITDLGGSINPRH